MVSDIWVPDDGSWVPHAPGSAQTRRDIEDIVTPGRTADPRAKLRREVWKIVFPLMTSTGWRKFRDTELDRVLDAAENAYKSDF